MVIIIDGYNLIKQAIQDRQIGEQERHRFIHMLSRYARRKKHKIVLVFDGGPQTWPSQEVIAGVKVIYSGIKETADSVIMKYIDDYRTKELFLVSSDNELGRFASKHGIASIGSEDFHYLLQEALRAPSDEKVVDQQPEIEIDDGVQDLDALMERASEVIPQKLEDQPRSKQRQATLQRISKRDRALLKKLHKL